MFLYRLIMLFQGGVQKSARARQNASEPENGFAGARDGRNGRSSARFSKCITQRGVSGSGGAIQPNFGIGLAACRDRWPPHVEVPDGWPAERGAV